jgi:two-component system, NarL family, response regulator DegU
VAPETIRIVIIDDHPIVRAGMRQVLATAPEMTVVAEGATGAEALRLIAEFQPDVLALDVNLPDMSGMEVTRRLRALDTPTAILILTVHDDQQTALALWEAGAAGYVLKDDALETLVSAVRTVARGENWLSPTIAGKVVRYTRGDKSPEQISPLTPRELEVLRLLAQGLDNETIAHQLILTRRTVQNHVSAIYGKLGVTSRAEAVLYALSHELARVPRSGSILDAR